MKIHETETEATIPMCELKNGAFGVVVGTTEIVTPQDDRDFLVLGTKKIYPHDCIRTVHVLRPGTLLEVV